MLTEKYYRNFFYPIKDIDGGGSEPSEPETYEPGTVIIEEQQVTTVGGDGTAIQVDETFIPPSELAITFDGKEYEVSVQNNHFTNESFYGEEGQDRYAKYPFFIRITKSRTGAYSWFLSTPELGTYTISAKIPGAAPVTIKPPRTITSELARLIKALSGTVTKPPRTVVNQLSALADMAEAGGIGGGGGGVLEVTDSQEGDTHTLDKTYGEIEAAINAGKAVWINDGGRRLFVNEISHISFFKGVYAGALGVCADSGITWIARADTEEGCRNSYPSYAS